MVPFFRNLFQQVGFTPTEDFKPQLLENGGFDFGPFGTAAVGDDVYFKLVQNLQDSFAMTAWQMVKEGTEPFSDVLSTQKFVMTTGLLSLYTQIEMPDDEPYNFSGGANTNTKLQWKLDYVNTISARGLAEPESPNYMVFDDEKPANPGSSFLFGGSGGFTTCQGVGDKNTTDGSVNTVVSSAPAPVRRTRRTARRALRLPERRLRAAVPAAHRLHGALPVRRLQHRLLRAPLEAVHDRRRRLRLALGHDRPQAERRFVRPAVRSADAAQRQDASSWRCRASASTRRRPFSRLWNTNDSNQHRVTMNQTLLAALGQSFTSDNNLTPLSEVGLASSHTTTSGECYGCHKSLDPMRMFFGNQYDFNDRNDFVKNPFNGSQPNPRPTGPLQAGFAFADVNWQSPSGGTSLADLGPLLLQATDQDSNDPTAAAAVRHLGGAEPLLLGELERLLDRATRPSATSSRTS